MGLVGGKGRIEDRDGGVEEGGVGSGVEIGRAHV